MTIVFFLTLGCHRLNKMAGITWKLKLLELKINNSTNIRMKYKVRRSDPPVMNKINIKNNLNSLIAMRWIESSIISKDQKSEQGMLKERKGKRVCTRHGLILNTTNEYVQHYFRKHNSVGLPCTKCDKFHTSETEFTQCRQTAQARGVTESPFPGQSEGIVIEAQDLEEEQKIYDAVDQDDDADDEPEDNKKRVQAELERKAEAQTLFKMYQKYSQPVSQPDSQSASQSASQPVSQSASHRYTYHGIYSGRMTLCK